VIGDSLRWRLSEVVKSRACLQTICN
jgi:hypothetical protein